MTFVIVDARHIFTRLFFIGNAITNKNPFDDKTLEKKLKKLDKEQKLRASEMFWKQRKFFIEKAFDDNDELR